MDSNLKTEKEKMLSGLYYDASDKELVDDRSYARNLLFKINNTSPSDKKKIDMNLAKLIRAEDEFYIEPPFYCDYGYNIIVGDKFYANYGCTILDVNKVKIGSNVLLGPNVHIYTAAHPVDPIERLSQKEFGKPVSIGDNVWIGGSSVICPGIVIGDNVVIGAGSVVTKDVPSNVIVGGNPAKIIRNI